MEVNAVVSVITAFLRENVLSETVIPVTESTGVVIYHVSKSVVSLSQMAIEDLVVTIFSASFPNLTSEHYCGMEDLDWSW